jgi:hypothetical protein
VPTPATAQPDLLDPARPVSFYTCKLCRRRHHDCEPLYREHLPRQDAVGVIKATLHSYIDVIDYLAAVD